MRVPLKLSATFCLLLLGCSQEPVSRPGALALDLEQPAVTPEFPENRPVNLVEIGPEPIEVDLGGLSLSEFPSQDEADQAARRLIRADTWTAEFEKLQAEILEEPEADEGLTPELESEPSSDGDAPAASEPQAASKADMDRDVREPARR